MYGVVLDEEVPEELYYFLVSKRDPTGSEIRKFGFIGIYVVLFSVVKWK